MLNTGIVLVGGWPHKKRNTPDAYIPFTIRGRFFSRNEADASFGLEGPPPLIVRILKFCEIWPEGAHS